MGDRKAYQKAYYQANKKRLNARKAATRRTKEAANAVRLNDNFDLLRQVVGEGQADAEIQTSFPLERLDRRETSCPCCTTSAC